MIEVTSTDFRNKQASWLNLADQGEDIVIRRGKSSYILTLKDDDEEYISKAEILAGIEAGLKDVKAGRTQSFDDFIKELQDELQD